MHKQLFEISVDSERYYLFADDELDALREWIKRVHLLDPNIGATLKRHVAVIVPVNHVRTPRLPL